MEQKKQAKKKNYLPKCLTTDEESFCMTQNSEKLDESSVEEKRKELPPRYCHRYVVPRQFKTVSSVPTPHPSIKLIQYPESYSAVFTPMEAFLSYHQAAKYAAHLCEGVQSAGYQKKGEWYYAQIPAQEK